MTVGTRAARRVQTWSRLLFGRAGSKKDEFDFSPYQKINYGCGQEKLPGYLNVDIDDGCKPDLLIKAGDLSSLPKRHFEEVYAKDVLEHIPRGKSLEALLEFSSLLQSGGKLVVQTTSIMHVAKMLESRPAFSDQFGWTICLFGNQRHPGDFHFTGFTQTTLKVHLKAAGFDVVSETMVDDWMMRYACVKTDAWDDLLDHSVNDEDFLQLAYTAGFYRDLDETGRTHFLAQLKSGIDRRATLIQINSSPERLFVTARKMGLE